MLSQKRAKATSLMMTGQFCCGLQTKGKTVDEKKQRIRDQNKKYMLCNEKKAETERLCLNSKPGQVVDVGTSGVVFSAALKKQGSGLF